MTERRPSAGILASHRALPASVPQARGMRTIASRWVSFLPATVLAAAAFGLSSAACAQSTLSVPSDVVTRTTTYEYHPDGRLKREVVEPDGALGVQLTSSLNLLPNNVRESVITGWDGVGESSRSTRTDYGADGRFPRATTNSLGHLEQREFDARFGLPTVLSDANGVVTRIDYDAFGRKKLERRGFADSSSQAFIDQTAWAYQRCADVSGGCVLVEGVAPVTFVTRDTSSSAGVKLAPSAKTYFDRLGREIRTEVEAIKNGALNSRIRHTRSS